MVWVGGSRSMNAPDDARGPAPATPVRVVFCGMAGLFSLLVLEELVRAGVSVAAIMLPALRERTGQTSLLIPRQSATTRRAALPMFAAATPRTILDVAAERNIPVMELGGPDIPAALTDLAFDAVAVACFSRRLPASLLRLPRLGCLNVHPSLLPAHRGPDPLFWIFHDGDEEAGVTIHLMDEGFDTGPILLSETLSLPDDMTEAALERAGATQGGILLVKALAALDAGTLQPRKQDASHASYQSLPQANDFVITPAWPARRAYRFLAGIGGRGEPMYFTSDGDTFALRAALDYDSGATLDAPWRLAGDVLSVRCAPGVLRCQIAP